MAFPGWNLSKRRNTETIIRNLEWTLILILIEISASPPVNVIYYLINDIFLKYPQTSLGIFPSEHLFTKYILESEKPQKNIEFSERKQFYLKGHDIKHLHTHHSNVDALIGFIHENIRYLYVQSFYFLYFVCVSVQLAKKMEFFYLCIIPEKKTSAYHTKNNV